MAHDELPQHSKTVNNTHANTSTSTNTNNMALQLSLCQTHAHTHRKTIKLTNALTNLQFPLPATRLKRFWFNYCFYWFPALLFNGIPSNSVCCILKISSVDVLAHVIVCDCGFVCTCFQMCKIVCKLCAWLLKPMWWSCICCPLQLHLFGKHAALEFMHSLVFICKLLKCACCLFPWLPSIRINWCWWHHCFTIVVFVYFFFHQDTLKCCAL